MVKVQVQPQTLHTTRARRVIYSNLCNFRTTDDMVSSTVNNSTGSACLVPMDSYPEAIRDAGKRGLLGAQLELVKNLFERRPIWTKSAVVEHESTLGAFALKYILPCVAYFALNGPWRSCWIRYGYDPRLDRFAYAYQLLDYRVPSKLDLNSTNMRSVLNFEVPELIDGVFLFRSLPSCDGTEEERDG